MPYYEGLSSAIPEQIDRQWPLVSSAADFETWADTHPLSGGGIRTILGEQLPSVPVSQEVYDYARTVDSIVPQRLLDETDICPIIGCWIPTMRSRRYGGYIGIGGKAVLEAELSISGSSVAHRLSLENYGKSQGREHLTPEDPVDHICRCTACFMPMHVRSVTNAENNDNKLRAQELEKQLRAGQLLMRTQIPWFDELVDSIADEPEGSFADVVIATRFGPYRLQKFGIAAVGIRVESDIRDQLKQPQRRNYPRKIPAQLPGQQTIA